MWLGLIFFCIDSIHSGKRVIKASSLKGDSLAHWKYSIALCCANQAANHLNIASPSNLPCLVARLPFASFRKSCHTASGRQGRGCAELNRSKAIQKRCASCGSKGTFDFHLSIFAGKFHDAHPPAHSASGTSKAVSQLRGFRIYAAPLPSPPQLSTAEYRDPEQLQGASSLRAVICRRLLPSALPLRPPST